MIAPTSNVILKFHIIYMNLNIGSMALFGLTDDISVCDITPKMKTHKYLLNSE